MKPPSDILNIDFWENNCRKIHARAMDLIDGRSGVIETARALDLLASWTRLQSDEDLKIFISIARETDFLPVGEVRKYWAPDSLEREDAKINKAEEQNRDILISAAMRLAIRFAWAIDARNIRRKRNTS
ncbi:MAG TPA: hypothetical protein VMG30_05875 [Acidobacteriota bacterium]|nr:hypothetical protein [Acidobacteriota bacterium]